MANKVISDGAHLQLHLDGTESFVAKDTFSVTSGYLGIPNNIALFTESVAGAVPFWIGAYTTFDEPTGTSAANLKTKIDALLDLSFDIYKEGTYTPVVTLTGAGTAPQYSTASGTYTCIGRACFINIRLDGDGGNEGSGAGIITISLPFSTSADQLAMVIGEGTSFNGATEHVLYVVLSSGSSTITIKRPQSATQLTDFTGADQNNTTRSINLMIKILV